MTETATSSIPLRFERPKHPFVVGKLYSRTWKAPFTNGLTDIWRERCLGYWESVGRRFGYVFSEPRNAWVDDPVQGPCVVTYATPLYRMEGERFGPPGGIKTEETVH